MKVMVSAREATLDSPVGDVFGRTPYFILVDTEDFSFEVVENPAGNQTGGAGVQAAQLVLAHEPDILLAPKLGPKAFEVLEAASLPCYSSGKGTVKDAVRDFEKGKLQPLSSSGSPGHGKPIPEREISGESTDRHLDQLTSKLGKLRGQVEKLLEEIAELPGEEK